MVLTSRGGVVALQQRSFQSEQRLLAVGAYDTVAREHDRQRIAVHHHADGTGGTRSCGTRSELAVRDDLAVRDARELVQDAAIEVRLQRQIHVQGEGVPLALEVLVELLPRG